MKMFKRYIFFICELLLLSGRGHSGKWEYDDGVNDSHPEPAFVDL